MKPRTKVILAFGLVAAALACWGTLSHFRARARVAHYKRQLQARGEKLTIPELAPPLSPEGIAASGMLFRAAGRLLALSPNGSNQPPVMQQVMPGCALVAWQQRTLPSPESEDVLPGLAAVLAGTEDDLAGIRAVLRRPAFSFDLDYNQGFNLLLPHLTQLRSISQWLSADAILALHDGRVTNAWDDLIALAHLVERYKDEPVLISMLVRITLGNIAANATWEALQAPACREDQLEEVQMAWETVDVLTHAESVFAMSRAAEESALALWRVSFPNLSGGIAPSGGSGAGLSEFGQLSKDVLDNPAEGIKNLLRRYPGYWSWKCWQSYDEELSSAQIVQAALDALRKARKEHALAPALAQFEQEEARLQRLHPVAGNWFGYSVAFGGEIKAVFTRLTGLEIQRSLLVTAIALKRYQLRRGSYPADLGGLIPDFLHEVPRDPMDGKPLCYRLNPGGSFLLYSVGEDGVDDGGDPSPVQPSSETTRARWWMARDAVWPKPATPAEALIYFEKQAAKRFRYRYGPAPAPPPPPAPTAVSNSNQSPSLQAPANLSTNLPR